MPARSSIVRWLLLLSAITLLGMMAATTTARVAAQECYWIENWQYVEEWGGWYDFGYWWCPTYGCTDPGALNYNPNANADDGSCQYGGPPPPPPPPPVYGCTDPNASNYNPSANADDGSCQYPPPSNPAFDAAFAGANALFLELLYRPIPVDYGTYVANAIVDGWFSLAQLRADILASPEYAALHPPPPPVYGCMDPQALNYNPNATVNDGSCQYPQQQSMNYLVTTSTSIVVVDAVVYAEVDAQDNSTGCPHADYTEVRLTSPSGRVASARSSTGSQGAVISATVSLPVDEDYGDYYVVGWDVTACPCGNVTFINNATSQSVPAPRPNVCAYPTNFHETNRYVTNGEIYFNYEWDSTSGRKADLLPCSFYEYHTTTPSHFPSPPWDPNIGINGEWPFNWVAVLGYGSDGHQTGGIMGPLSNASVKVVQEIGFKCPCWNFGNFTVMDGPYDIDRSISRNTDGTYKYTVTTRGTTATINPVTPHQ